MTALALIEQELQQLGYGAATLHRSYSFADVLGSRAETRTVVLAAFTQAPESFRSAAFGVVQDERDSSAAVMASRALGAPIFFSIDSDDVGVWSVGARDAPRLLERVKPDQIPNLFHRYREQWAPQALHRAKAIGIGRDPVQSDFIDLGLLPAIEHEVQAKLHQSMTDALELLLSGEADQEGEKAAFRLTFRLLAAKILVDRGHPAALDWDVDDVEGVLNGIQAYYGLGLLGEDVRAVSLGHAAAAWARLGKAITLKNISSDSLAFVYENTLVTADTRKMFGTHSTPRPVAEYVLSRINLSRYAGEDIRIAEPFAGAGIFLVAALRELRDQLPSDWLAERRHQFLVDRMAGAELDVFACEVAALSLILADYPNANGWHVRSADLFKDGALKAFLTGATVVLCNPPFEDFSAEDRLEYPEAFAVSPSKAMVALHAAIDAAPDAIGFILPRGVLQQSKYRKLRERLAANYGRVEFTSLPDRIFEKASYPCALVIASDRRPEVDLGLQVRLSARTVSDADRTQFLAEGKVTSVRHAFRPAPDGDLWISELAAIWSYLKDTPQLGSIADISRGLEWHSQREGVFHEPGSMRKQGIYRPIDSLTPFHITNTVWLSCDPESARRLAPLRQPWDSPKVIINNHRSSRGPWRLMAAADESSLWASQQFTGIWPTSLYDVKSLAAILNGPVASAFLTEHSPDHHFTKDLLSNMPLPRSLDTKALSSAVSEYQAVLSEKQNAILSGEDYDKQLNQLLVWIDALVLQGYDLPPRLERQLFDFFDGRKRPVQHDFQGWLPANLTGYVPLHEWLTRDTTANRGTWVLDVFKPAPAEENDALSRFLD